MGNPKTMGSESSRPVHATISSAFPPDRVAFEPFYAVQRTLPLITVDSDVFQRIQFE